MNNSQSAITLDMRGEVCPTPLIKAMEAMKGAEKGQFIDMITDFLPAILTVSNAALKEGWNINVELIAEKEWIVRLIPVANKT